MALRYTRMTNQVENLSVEQDEQRARNLLHPQIIGHLNLANEVCSLIWRVDASFNDTRFQDMPEPLLVRLILLSRIADDLRVIQHLCLMGYSEQACALGATVFENAHTSVFIGTDDERADQWINHDDPKQSFRPVRQMVKENVSRLAAGDKDIQVDAEYDVYTQLCWFKHTNPMVQDLRDPNFWELYGTLRHSPDTSEQGVRQCWKVLEEVSRLGLFAAVETLDQDVPGDQRGEIAAMVEKMNPIFDELHKRAKDRWGTSRPFRGEW